MKDLKYYEIQYASGLWEQRNNLNTVCIQSNKELGIGQFIIVEHIGYGVFVGKVLEEKHRSEEIRRIPENLRKANEYRFIQYVDLSDYLKSIENAKRKEMLKEEMEKRFAEIDKEKKYEYYASIDSSFKELLDEYRNL